jgi:hypothetical protein
LTDGQGFSDPQTGQPTAYRPPLYTLLLAAVIRCGGSDIAIGITQMLLGAATVGLTIDAGCRLGLGRGSIVAGVLVAVDPILLYETSQVMTETLATFLAALCLWLCISPASRRTSLLIGLVFGAACLCRPTFWAFGVSAGSLWLVWLARSMIRSDRRDRSELRRAIITLAGVLAVVGPWAIRNFLVMGRPIITTTHGGYTLLLPHNPEYTRAVVEQPWSTVWQSPSFNNWLASIEGELAALNPPLDHKHLDPQIELARDAWMNDRAWSYINQDRTTAVKAGLTLLGRMWNIAPASDVAVRPTRLRVAIGAFYIPVLVALLVGMFRTIPSGRQSWWLPAVMIFSFSAVHFLYWADMRMRAPLVPAIALLAAASWFEIQRACAPPPA